MVIGDPPKGATPRSDDVVDIVRSAKFAKELERKIWVRIWLANLAGVIPINIFLFLGTDVFTQRYPYPAWKYTLVTGMVYAVAYAWSRIQARRAFRPIAAWIEEGREPNHTERDYVISHPRKLAVISFWAWAWAIVCMYVAVVIYYEFIGIHYVRMFVSASLAMTLACGLTYLVAENALRPLFSVVLVGEVRKRRSIGVLPRLALAWIVGSGSYLVTIALLADFVPASEVRGHVLIGCAFGLAVGMIVTLIAARSVARPLDEVRQAIARVEDGLLDVSVPVNDAGEIGQLQAGFNRMVAGLRERDRLQLLFGRHVGADVARRALDGGSLEGSERIVTVMFVDVIGSTTLAAERSPAAVVAMLNGLFSAVVRIVAAEGGLVNQFQGDGALCIFGAPIEVPDHASCALRAARALRREITMLGDTYPGFEAAIGVSTGPVVAGDIGTEDRYEYTVIGDAANEASRLSDEAKSHPGHVLVGDTTITAAGVTSDGWRRCGELALRGRPQPTFVYEPAL